MPALFHYVLLAQPLSATSVYVIDGRELRHRWTAQILDDAALDHELAAAGLTHVRFLDPETEWALCAIP